MGGAPVLPGEVTMLNAGPSGFDHAPVTKGLVLSSGFLSLLAALTDTQGLMRLDLFPSVVPNLHLWRLVTGHLVFTSPSEVLFGLLLLYNFRCFERQMGSRRFGAFTLSSLSMATLLQVAFLVLFPSVRYVSSGTYGLVFALFVLFHRDIPKTTRFRVFGITLSDKMFTYLLGLQLLVADSPRSVLAALSGLVSGAVLRSDTLGLRERLGDLPDPVVAFFRRFCLPLIASAPRPQQVSAFAGQGHAVGGVAGANGQMMQAGHMQGTMGAAPGAAAGGAYSETLVNPAAQGMYGLPSQLDAQQMAQLQMMYQQQAAMQQQAASAMHAPMGGADMQPMANPVSATHGLTAEPSEENIDHLVSMGFSRDQASAALAQSGNNVSAAAMMLTGG